MRNHTPLVMDFDLRMLIAGFALRKCLQKPFFYFKRQERQIKILLHTQTQRHTQTLIGFSAAGDWINTNKSFCSPQ